MSILTDHSADAPAPEAGFDLLASREYVVPRANLLPPEIAERAALRRLVVGMAVAVVAAGGVIGAVYVSTEGGRAPVRATLADAQAQHGVLAAQQAKLAPSQAAHQQVLAAKTSLQAAMGSEVLWSDQMNTLRSHLTDGVRLSSLTVKESAGAGSGSAAAVTLPAAPAGSGASTAAAATPTKAAANDVATATLTGVAISNYALAAWMKTLAALPGWEHIFLTGTAANSAHAGLVTYTITADLTNAVLSHRYTNGG
jgi:Tfp pilus assembly protein PilN